MGALSIEGVGKAYKRYNRKSGRLAEWLDGETLHGSLWRAGLPKTMLSA